MIYDKNEDETTVRAEFRFGGAFGTKLELSSPASIKFNGTAIPYNSTLAYFQNKFPGFVSSGNFTYVDVDGSTYTNSTGTIKAVAFIADPIIITSGVDYVMSFLGDAIGANDVVTLNISDKIFATTIIGAQSLTLGGVQTSGIDPGPYIGYMYRTVTQTPAQTTPEGGTIWLTYKAFNKAIDIQ